MMTTLRRFTWERVRRVDEGMSAFAGSVQGSDKVMACAFGS
jgi:hypothetical protein